MKYIVMVSHGLYAQGIHSVLDQMVGPGKGDIISVSLQDGMGDVVRYKGPGGIRTREHFLQLIDMGIDRMGVGYRSSPVVLNIAAGCMI